MSRRVEGCDLSGLVGLLICHRQPAPRLRVAWINAPQYTYLLSERRARSGRRDDPDCQTQRKTKTPSQTPAPAPRGRCLTRSPFSAIIEEKPNKHRTQKRSRRKEKVVRVQDVPMVIRGHKTFYSLRCGGIKFLLGLSTSCVAFVAATDINLRDRLECGSVTVMEVSCQTGVR